MRVCVVCVCLCVCGCVRMCWFVHVLVELIRWFVATDNYKTVFCVLSSPSYLLSVELQLSLLPV
jgi:hypothetical protein